MNAAAAAYVGLRAGGQAEGGEDAGSQVARRVVVAAKCIGPGPGLLKQT